MNIEGQYLRLLKDILDNGVQKEDRTGVGTLSVYGRQLRHKMSEGFPLLTTKKMYWRGIVAELIWFLRGDTNIKYLVDTDCHIWDGDAYKNYFNKTKDLTKDDFEAKGNGVIVIKGFDLKSINQYGNISGTISNSYFIPYTQEEFINKIKTNDEFAKKWGELGPIYGNQWRKWAQYSVPEVTFGTGSYTAFRREIDQIQNLINELKTNPDSRRLMVNAWNVGELDQMTLPPCHYGFQVYTRELSLSERLNLASTIIGEEKIRTHEDNLERVEKLNIPTRAISLMWNQRSVDTFLGLPFNIASYALLLHIIGEAVNMVPEELICNLGDTHIYLNHVDAVKEQLTREPRQLPRLRINTEFWPTESGECGIGPLHSDISVLIDNMQIDDFGIERYEPHPPIKAQLNN